MKTAAKAAALVLFTTWLAGCGLWRHKVAAAPPPPPPSVPLSEVANNVPPPYLPTPPLPIVNPPTVATVQPLPLPEKTTHHSRPRHITIPASPPEPAPKPQPTPQQFANGIPTDISPIGQLSAAGESTNLERRHQIIDEIDATEKSLDKIKRPLSKEEETTITQIHTFLEKAKLALNQADLDGAHTLVIKAQVLLKEIART
jgi:hypothetical protein